VHHIEENYRYSYHFLKILATGGCKDITVMGTCFEYGMQQGCLHEELPLQPVTAYGLGKAFLQQSLDALQKHVHFHYKWIRLFYLYGQGQPETSLLGQLDQAIARNEPFKMSLGEQIRDYLTVEIVADYIVRIALQEKIHGIINCCSGQPISVRRLIEEYCQAHDSYIPLELGYYKMPRYEALSFYGCTKKLNQILGDSL
jgi:dTDP-6-deoxy-L-talose 4-dehydrogenase (NAD+)